MKITPDKCPKCGEPPRYLKAKMICTIPILRGTKGYKLALGIFKTEPIRYEKISQQVTLECGGGHKWNANSIQEEE